MSQAEPKIRWTLLGILLAALWLLSKISGPESLDAKTLARPRNPRLEVRLQKMLEGSRLELDVIGLWELRSGGGDLVAKGDGMRGWLSYSDRMVSVGGWQSKLDHLVLHTFGDAALILDTWRYRGHLHLRTKAAKNGTPRHLEIALKLPLEDYVLGVVTGEMATSKNGIQEALRAQAIAARSYAVFQIFSGRTQLSSTPSDQRFLPVDLETAAAREAVAKTRGQILRHDEQFVPAFFHADCGGATSNGTASGFGHSDVLQAVLEPYSGTHASNPHTWSKRVEAKRLDELAADLNLGEYTTGLQILQRDDGGRVMQAKFTGTSGSHKVLGEELRRLLQLPSAMIDLIGVLRDGSVILEGRGRGHGIGLCQVGAQALALQGRTCQQILGHYYPGARIELLTEPISIP
ncbi:MAG: SpoIID/LytB domain-containing protein [Planctomycetes bacterium]|nr:SpoIID/LytB domain-containing protein [Planctomycetota bacterium]